MTVPREALERAPVRLRPLYRLSRDHLFTLTVVSATIGVEYSSYEHERPAILVVQDDIAAGEPSPFLERENTQRVLAQCELVAIFKGASEPLQVSDLAMYAAAHACDVALIETTEDRADGWVKYASAANAGDMHITVYEAPPQLQEGS